jgi:hypothetical protein
VRPITQKNQAILLFEVTKATSFKQRNSILAVQVTWGRRSEAVSMRTDIYFHASFLNVADEVPTR